MGKENELMNIKPRVKRITRLLDTSITIPRHGILTYGSWFEGKATPVGAILDGEVHLHTPQLEYIGVSPEQIMEDLKEIKRESGLSFNVTEYQPTDSYETPYEKVKLE